MGLRSKAKEVPEGSDLEGIEAEGEDKLKSVREDNRWRTWWLLAAAMTEDLKRAALHMDLTTLIFSISRYLSLRLLASKKFIGEFNTSALLLFYLLILLRHWALSLTDHFGPLQELFFTTIFISIYILIYIFFDFFTFVKIY